VTMAAGAFLHRRCPSGPVDVNFNMFGRLVETSIVRRLLLYIPAGVRLLEIKYQTRPYTGIPATTGPVLIDHLLSIVVQNTLTLSIECTKDTALAIGAPVIVGLDTFGDEQKNFDKSDGLWLGFFLVCIVLVLCLLVYINWKSKPRNEKKHK